MGTKIKKSDFIYDEISKLFPNAKCELNYRKDYELLIAIMLSAQTTDISVNKVTDTLFNKYHSVSDFAKAEISSNDIGSSSIPTGELEITTKLDVIFGIQ
jgi:endonuclease III